MAASAHRAGEVAEQRQAVLRAAADLLESDFAYPDAISNLARLETLREATRHVRRNDQVPGDDAPEPEPGSDWPVFLGYASPRQIQQFRLSRPDLEPLLSRIEAGAPWEKGAEESPVQRFNLEADAADALDELVRKLYDEYKAEHGKPVPSWGHPDLSAWWESTAKDWRRLKGMGITSPEQLEAVHKAYREELLPLAEGYRKGLDDTARKRAEEELRLRHLVNSHKVPGFFPTPPAVQRRMFELGDEYGDPNPQRILEPSAGVGSLIDGIHEQHPGAAVDALEWDHKLRTYLEERGDHVVGDDFLEHNPGPVYDRIYMNPPFENHQDIDHVMHAADLLDTGGVLVAVMSEGAFTASDRKARRFQEWVDDEAAEVVKLPAGSFSHGLRPTSVATRLIVVQGPQHTVR